MYSHMNIWVVVDDRSPVWFSHAPPNHHLVWEMCATLQEPARLLQLVLSNEDRAVCFANGRHERIHTKRGSYVKMQAAEEGEEDVDDLATLEVLDEVREARQCANLC